MKKRFYSHGKLLLSGEYVVLDGALALALPTRQGQWLEVRSAEHPGLEWNSLDAEGSTWFQTHFSQHELLSSARHKSLPDDIRDRLLYILQALEALKPGFLKQSPAVKLETRLEFPRLWGLGSSSTLLANLAQWAGVNPFTLSEMTLGGSGYDLACAGSSGPILYQRDKAGKPSIKEVAFHPPFSDALTFVYLGQKQDSREGIALYKAKRSGRQEAVRAISELSSRLASAPDLPKFREEIEASETILSELLGLPRVKDLYFSDFDGSVKSLGAWGGDFVLAAGGSNPRAYFHDKGFHTSVSYREMIL